MKLSNKVRVGDVFKHPADVEGEWWYFTVVDVEIDQICIKWHHWKRPAWMPLTVSVDYTPVESAKVRNVLKHYGIDL